MWCGCGGFIPLKIKVPLPGEMIHFDEHIFQMGWNHHLVDGCGSSGADLVGLLKMKLLCFSDVDPAFQGVI